MIYMANLVTRPLYWCGALALWLAAGLGSFALAASTAIGTGGAIASVSTQASAAGLEILERGGNAVDAAVAAAATLGVTDPFSCGIGGGGFMVIYLARDHRVITIDHRETAPAAFTPGAFRDAAGAELPFDAALRSGLSVGVPGTVRGWELALARYGSMRFDQVLQPAIDLAEHGFTISPLHGRIAYRDKMPGLKIPAARRGPNRGWGSRNPGVWGWDG
jgi:gamma-glutamyltranspeptidase/glutathione hydrolase